MAMIPQFQASYTATAATTVLTSGPALLHTIVLPKSTAGTISVQDVATNVYFAIPTASIGSLRYDSVCNNGLQIVQGSAADQIVTTWQAL